MAISDSDPRLRDIIAAAKVALEQQDEMERANDPSARFASAGSALHAASEIMGKLKPAILERFREHVPADTRIGYEPEKAVMLKLAYARIWDDVLAAHVPQGGMLTNGLLLLAKGDKPWLMQPAEPVEGRRSSKPNSTMLSHTKETLVLRAYYDAGFQNRAALDVLAEHLAGSAGPRQDDTNIKKNWIKHVRREKRELARETGAFVRKGLTLSTEQADMQQRVLRYSPEQLFDFHIFSGGTPR